MSVILVALACGLGDDVPTLERRAQQLNKAIMCPVCPGESIDQSQNALALQMRDIAAEKLRQGWSEDQIKEFFVERYGPSVLMEPPREGFLLTVWVVPPLAVIAAGIVLFMALRIMRRSPSVGAAGAGCDAMPSDAELAHYYRRIEEALGGHDAAQSQDRRPI